MARTRVRQDEQVKSSQSYDDQLNMSTTAVAVEGQPGDQIGSGNIQSFTSSDVVMAGDMVSLGANIDDQVTISASENNDGVYSIIAISYDSVQDETTLTVDAALNAAVDSGTPLATVSVDEDKSLVRDLDFIRTQIRKLNNSANWYDDPQAASSELYHSVVMSQDEATGYVVDLETDAGSTFDAGAPYTLHVFVNGMLQLPSSVSGSSITSVNDYTELDDSDQPLETGEGAKIRIERDLEEDEIIQFRWTKS